MTPSASRNVMIGLLILGIGIAGLVVAYQYRPPSGAMDALSMLVQGKQRFLQPGPYKAALAASVLVLLWGISILFRATIPKQSAQS